MSTKAKKFFSNPWTIAIGSGLILSLISVVVDYVDKKKAFTTFVAVVKGIWKLLISFLTYDLKVWWVLIGVGIVVFGLYLYSRYLDVKEATPPEPPFFKYTDDFLLGYKWAWAWKKQYDGTYNAEDIHLICDKCNTPLIYDFYSYEKAKCIRCGKRYHKDIPRTDHVKLLVMDNAKRVCNDNQEQKN